MDVYFMDSDVNCGRADDFFEFPGNRIVVIRSEVCNTWAAEFNC